MSLTPSRPRLSYTASAQHSASATVAPTSPKAFSPASPVTKATSPSRLPPYTPGGASIAFDVVTSALEQDWEMERRELRDQVSFLNRVHAQEKELLLQRNEALEKQFVDGRDMWYNERKLLTERLNRSEAAAASTSALRQAEHDARFEAAAERFRTEELALTSRADAERRSVEAEAARWADSVEMLRSTVADLEAQLEAAHHQATAANARAEAAERAASIASTAERTAAETGRSKLVDATARLAAVEAERERTGLADRERLDAKDHALSNAREELARQRRSFDEEVLSLNTQVQQWQMEHARAEHESKLQLHRTEADGEKRVSLVRQECQDEGRQAMMQAMWQLQMADDCMQSMHQHKLQEVSASEARRRESEDLRYEAQMETSLSQRLTTMLGESQSEQSCLLRKFRAAEDELQAERASRAHHECRNALAAVELQRQVLSPRVLSPRAPRGFDFAAATGATHGSASAEYFDRKLPLREVMGLAESPMISPAGMEH
mmetsp:Transcript_76140/g.134739  ORF Transcript_76140/g.134739 Transcript_76140/m.134739 type:complete len:496 (-) Transcript_76140:33-1520(-)